MGMGLGLDKNQGHGLAGAFAGINPESGSEGFIGQVSEWLRATLASGRIHLVNAVSGVFDRLQAREIKADNIESRSGITIYDRTTGLPFCVGIDNGQTVTTSGACGAPVMTPASIPSPQESPPIAIEETSPTPTPQPSPEALASPEPSAERGSAGTAEPESSSPEPSPEIIPAISTEPSPEP
jgi:hypothetical protein